MFNWGDGTTSEWTTQPNATHQWNLPGIYDVSVKAKDDLGAESDWSVALHVTISMQLLPSLDLTITPSPVPEGNDVVVLVTSDNLPVYEALVVFASTSKLTDASGTATFTAPQVIQNTPYEITASHEGYHSATQTIIVLNQREQVDTGWVYGAIDDGTTALEGVQILLSSGSNSWSTSTDKNGQYVASVPVGTYTVTVSKEGYQSQTKNDVSVEKNIAREENFVLIHEELPTPSETQDTNTGVIETLIKNEVEKGNIGAMMQVDQQQQTVMYYNDALTIDVAKLENVISFTVSAEEGTTAQVPCRSNQPKNTGERSESHHQV